MLQNLFYLCASIGAIATAISLGYLFIKDYKKTKKISQLELVAETLQKDLELKYEPHLWINGVQLRQADNEVRFYLNNKREWCRLLEFNIISGDLIFDEQNKYLPYELEPKFSDEIISDTTRRYIFSLNNSDKNLNDIEYVFEIVYENRIGIKYSVRINGNGNNCKVETPTKL